MLHSLIAFTNRPIQAHDGAAGRVCDFLVDDHSWEIRFLVSRLGPFLFGVKRLIPREYLSPFGTHSTIQALPVDLAVSQVENCREWDSSQRQFEVEDNRFEPRYSFMTSPQENGPSQEPPGDNRKQPFARDHVDIQSSEDHSTVVRPLKPFSEIVNCQAVNKDGDPAVIEDLLLDDTAWRIPFLVIKEQHRMPGKRICLSVKRLDGIDLGKRRASLKLSTDEMTELPEFDSTPPISPTG